MDDDTAPHTTSGPAGEPHRAPPGAGAYRIEIAGRAGRRALQPLEDDFSIVRGTRTTVVQGEIRDPAHLHGVLTRLASMGLTILSLTPDGQVPGGIDAAPTTTRASEAPTDPGVPSNG